MRKQSEERAEKVATEIIREAIIREIDFETVKKLLETEGLEITAPYYEVDTFKIKRGILFRNLDGQKTKLKIVWPQEKKEI